MSSKGAKATRSSRWIGAWVRRADDELAGTGARPRKRELTATEPLTSQETRVALHAAKGPVQQGDRSRAVPEPQDRGGHLSSVYRKRGFRSRTELAAAFRGP